MILSGRYGDPYGRAGDLCRIRESWHLIVKVTNLPPSEGNNSYKCYINGKERPTSTLPGGKLACRTPLSNQLPKITSETGDVFVDLALYSTESKKVFVSKVVGFYSCSAVKGCQNCAEGGYRCNWCTYRGLCTDDVNAECPGEFILPIQDRTAGSKGCPRLKSNTTLYIPVGIKTNISLPAYDLPPSKSGASYKCDVTVDGKMQSADALRVSDTQLVCSARKYSYYANLTRQAVKLTITFKNSDQLFVPSTFEAYLYKCWVSRTDCSICHYDSTAEPYLKCGWCKADTNKCVVQEACNEVGGFWIPYSLPCRTKPIITKVWPLAGPISGGTEVEIYGYDLGKSFFDINNTVTVAGYSCVTNPDKYQPSKRVFCNTSASSGPVSGPVTVTVNNLKGQSAKQFHYQVSLLTACRVRRNTTYYVVKSFLFAID
ncbi:plexin A3-like [Porites lutea]|uniref:plexin A3-like n=1 Tax=Porites lutea TaxID=51062 RepID=UPI003CC68EAC